MNEWRYTSTLPLCLHGVDRANVSPFFAYIGIIVTAFRRQKPDFLKHDSTYQTLRHTGPQNFKYGEYQISTFFIQNLHVFHTKFAYDMLNEIKIQ